MRKLTPVPMDATAHAVYLTGAAINSLIQALPLGTAYGIGIVRIVMMTGRLMQHKGSLARAVLPLVIHLKWAGTGLSERWSAASYCWMSCLITPISGV